MLRRTFAVGILAVITFTTLTTLPASANKGTIEYKVGDIKKALANGKTVFVDYAADWCGTCKSQERTINRLRTENPAYNKSITFIRVDWDKFQSDEVTTSRNIPRRSTLIVLKGQNELGRLVAGTSKNDIKTLLDLGL